MGQNFLVSPSALDRVARFMNVRPDDRVIEAAAGPGLLTRRLAGMTSHLTAVEKDRRLIPVLKEQLGDRPVRVIEGDILSLDWEKLVGEHRGEPSSRLLVVGNLPYQIATGFITGLLEKRLLISEISVMIQKEVAERCAAGPGSRDYGFLSLWIQYHAECVLGPVIQSSAFYPAPRVASRMARFVPRTCPPVEVDVKGFFSFVKKILQYRRKQLAGALEHAAGISRADARKFLSRIDRDLAVRPGQLSMQDYASLYSAWQSR